MSIFSCGTSRVPIFTGRKKLHFVGTNFRKWLFTKRFAGITFHESRFFVIVVVDGLRPVAVTVLGSRWAWRLVWGDGNNEWKCCHSTISSSIWKAAKGTSYRTKEQNNGWDLPFSSDQRRERSRAKITAAKKATEEERSEVKRHLGYVAKPKIKKKWRQGNYCTWLGYVFKSAFPLFKSNFFLCLSRVEKSQNFGFSRFFHA